jgi:FxLD family lantipeptide
MTIRRNSMSTNTIDQPQTLAPAGDPLDLDVRIVESGDAVNALLGDTDDGCNTVKGSDC